LSKSITAKDIFAWQLRSKHGGMLRRPSLLTLNHTNMIEITTLQTLLELAMMLFLGALALILWE
jgi:hypothetical protein